MEGRDRRGAWSVGSVRGSSWGVGWALGVGGWRKSIGVWEEGQ